jgi:hypothetical protein
VLFRSVRERLLILLEKVGIVPLNSPRLLERPEGN